jgi:hypothetical protein
MTHHQDNDGTVAIIPVESGKKLAKEAPIVEPAIIPVAFLRLKPSNILPRC